MSGLPGFVDRTAPRHIQLRIVLWGLWKTGKTRLALTFPAPLLIHPVVESGYDTALFQGRYLAQPVILGETHAAALRGQPGTSIKAELDQWLTSLHAAARRGDLPYKTIILGGFSDLLRMVQSEAEKHAEGSNNKYESWQEILSWTLRTTQLLFALPCHVIIEVGAKELHEDKRDSGRVTGYTIDLQGQTRSVLLRQATVIAWQERTPAGAFRTHFRQSARAFAETRVHELKTTEAVDNCGYDYFSRILGLPPIWEADPKHPRCQPGCWPWDCEWHA
jgi:hypothetical protein